MNSYKIEFSFVDYVMADNVEEAKKVFMNSQQGSMASKLVNVSMYLLDEDEDRERRLH